MASGIGFDRIGLDWIGMDWIGMNQLREECVVVLIQLDTSGI